MKTIEFTNGMELNIVGGRYVKGNHYVDVTEHYYCVGTLTEAKEFELATECGESEAYAWLQ